MTKFRGHFCVDGGVMAFIPTVPTVEYTVKVGAWLRRMHYTPCTDHNCQETFASVAACNLYLCVFLG